MSGGGKKTTTNETRQTRTNEKFSRRPIVPEGYLEALDAATPGGFDFFRDETGKIREGLGNIRTDLDDPLNYFREQRNRDTHTLATLAQNYPELYSKIAPLVSQDVTAGTTTARDTTAQSGADFRARHFNPFIDEVVATTGADLGNAFAKTLVQSGLDASAGGAFGGGRHAIREAQLGDDFFRTFGSTIGGLRKEGFNIASLLGQTDADRFLLSDTGNADRTLLSDVGNRDAALLAATGNADRRFNVDKFNADFESDRQKFDVNAAFRGDELRDQAARDAVSVMGAQAGLLGDEQNLINNMARFDSMTQQEKIQFLQAFFPLFGEQGEGSGTTDSTGKTITKESGGGFADLLGGFGSLALGLGSIGFNPFEAAGDGAVA